MSVVLGLGASLASAGLVKEWISGVVVLYSRSFRIGDYVKVGDVEGYVTEMGPLATKLHTIRMEEITVPNAVMTSDKLINYSRLGDEQGALLSVALAIGSRRAVATCRIVAAASGRRNRGRAKRSQSARAALGAD